MLDGRNIKIPLYRYIRSVITPSVSTLEVDDIEASFYTRTPAETHQVLGPSRAELPLVNQVINTISEGDIVYDIGANAGLYTIFCALSKEVSVQAFEPVPSNAELLRENLALNNVEADLQEIAVGADNDKVNMSQPNRIAHGTTEIVGYSDDDTITVELRSIDSLVGGYFEPPDIVKIDVEGHENAVIDGMTSVLEDNPPRVLFIEIHNDVDKNTIYSTLSDAGYLVNEVFERSAERFIEARNQ